MLVKFTADEEKEYSALAKEALDSYVKFRNKAGTKLSRHYLVLQQKLVRQRVACAGGHVPLNEGQALGVSSVDDDGNGPDKADSKPSAIR